MLSRVLICLLALIPATLCAHEFWIEPQAYQIESGEVLQADFKNGEEFRGTSLAYFDRGSARFELYANSKRVALTPRSGDRPALDVPAPIGNGLVVIAHETTPSRLTYREWAKFMRFAEHKDFPSAAATHRANGWSESQFRERYTRHVKALIAVGNGTGADVNFGMRTEFIALTNPYAPDFAQQMKVRLLMDGQPRSNAQIEVFARAPDGSVSISLFRTNSRGEARIPVDRGQAYLFDAVVLQPAPEATREAGALVWETYWAALTFAVPE
ncbi:MAG: DUF4198 domain-containing protein [Pseudomonadota bacterium]